nr:hypothetical protein [Tanacetum cinerariifolium]
MAMQANWSDSSSAEQSLDRESESELCGAFFQNTARFEKNKSHNVERAETRETSESGLVRRLLRSRGKIGVAASKVTKFCKKFQLQGFGLKKFLICGSALETGLLDFSAFRFVNDKVAAGGYRQEKVLNFFDCPVLRQGVEDLRELLHNVLCLIRCL